MTTVQHDKYAAPFTYSISLSCAMDKYSNINFLDECLFSFSLNFFIGSKELSKH